MRYKKEDINQKNRRTLLEVHGVGTIVPNTVRWKI